MSSKVTNAWNKLVILLSFTAFHKYMQVYQVWKWGGFGVELRGFWCGTEGFWCWTEGFLMLNWGIFGGKLRDFLVLNWEILVLNWRVFGVELRDFGCWKGVVLVLNWCVELRGSVWNWRVLFWGFFKRFEINWWSLA